MARLARALCLAAAAIGCSPCDDEGSRVPFKRGSQVAAPQAAEPAVADTSFPIKGQSHPPGTHSIELQGHTLQLGEHAARASMSLDLDADLDNDALLILEATDGSLSLSRAIYEGQGLQASEHVADLTSSDGATHCQTASVGLEQLAGDFLVVSASPACVQPGSTADAPSPTAPNAPPRPPEPNEVTSEMLASAVPSDWLWVVRLDANPSVIERIHLRAAAGDEPTLSASLRAQDLDADGHSDLVLGLEVKGPNEGAAEHLELAFFDRPGGLSRDGNEPEASWLKLADEAKALRRSQPDRAAQIAERVLTQHALLCGETNRARIELSGTRGLACGASLAAGRAQTIAIAVLARKGRLLEAVRRFEAIEPSVFRLTDNDRERAKAALDERIESSVVWSAGPRAALGPMPKARRSAIAFLDQKQVLIRGRTALTYDLESGESAPTGVEASTTVIDPSKQLALVELRSQCDGVVAKLVHSRQVVAGIVTGPAVAETHVLPGSNAPCVLPDAPVHREIEIIDWTARGLLLAEDDRLHLVPLGAEGELSGEVVEIESSASPPALTLPSTLSENGRYRVVSSSLGIVWIDRASSTARLVPWPAPGARTSLDMAVSPLGTRIAVLSAGQLHVARLDAPSAPPPTSGPAPEAPRASRPPPAPPEPSEPAP